MLVSNELSMRKIILLIALFVFAQNYCFGQTESSSNAILKGGIKGAALRTEDGLVKISETAEIVKETSTNIVKETTRKDTVVFRGPNYGVVIPWVGGDGGVMKFGSLPIRRGKLDNFVRDTDSALMSLNSQMDALILPDDLTSQSMEIWNNIKTEREIAINHLTKLKELASAKKLVNLSIGREALAIYDSMTILSKLSNTLLEQISKSK